MSNAAELEERFYYPPAKSAINREDFMRLIELLPSTEGAMWRFYDKKDVESLFGAFRC